jgi:excisionase family DNA binding protein
VPARERDGSEAYLTVNQACELAGISRATFYKLLDDPRSGLADIAYRIPGLGRIRLRRRELCEWLESCPTKLARRSAVNPLDVPARRGM